MNKNSRKLLLLFLTVGIAGFVLLTFIGCPQNEPKGIDEDLASYIPPDAIAAAVVHPQRVLQNPDLDFLPLKTISGHCFEEFGFDPLDVKTVVMTFSPPSPEARSLGTNTCVVVRMTKPYTLDQLGKAITKNAEKSTYKGQPCLAFKYEKKKSITPIIYMPDDRTFLIATTPMLGAMLANHERPEKGPARKLIDTIDSAGDLAFVADIQSIRPLLADADNSQSIPFFPKDMELLPELIDSVRLQARVLGNPVLSVNLTAGSEQDAEEATAMINNQIDLTMTKLKTNSEETGRIGAMPTDSLIFNRQMKQFGHYIEKYLRPTQEGKTISWVFVVPPKNQITALKQVCSFIDMMHKTAPHNINDDTPDTIMDAETVPDHF